MTAARRRALGLLLCFATAKTLLFVLRALDPGGRIPVSALTVPVLLHQDALFVLGWAGLDLGLCRASRSCRMVHRAVDTALWALYALVVAYSALNMPIALRLSTPLTHSMLSAVGRALTGSILKYVTVTNVVAVGVVVLAALAPLRLRPPSRRGVAIAGAALLALGAGGAAAAPSVETLGLHRNPLIALAVTSLKRLGSGRHLGPVRVAPLPDEGRALDLSGLRGRAAGRNVIWVILESTGARYIGSFGKAPDPTPHLTELAARALVFEQAYCAIPDSIRGLFSMLCSTAPQPYLGIEEYTNDKLGCTSIAEALRAAGYRTGLFHSGRFRYLGMQGIVEGRGFHELHDAESIPAQYQTPFGIDDASTVARVLAFIDAVPSGQRFFAVYSPIAGHHPYKAPGPSLGPFPARTDLELYLNDLYTGDVAFGRLVEGVRARGLFERTLWVVVGDHGQAFQQHPGNFGHTLFVYEENTHVPLIIAAPGLVQEQVRPPQVSSLIDLAPTTLGLLGLPIPERYQGRVVLDPRPGFARFMTDHDLLKAGLRHAHWKYLYESEHDRGRLFDLDVDPEERTSVAEREPERARLYREDLLAWLGTR